MGCPGLFSWPRIDTDRGACGRVGWWSFRPCGGGVNASISVLDNAAQAQPQADTQQSVVETSNDVTETSSDAMDKAVTAVVESPSTALSQDEATDPSDDASDGADTEQGLDAAETIGGEDGQPDSTAADDQVETEDGQLEEAAEDEREQDGTAPESRRLAAPKPAPEKAQNAIYVSSTGNDSADGRSVDTAYASLQTAINACPEGGTVYIAGVYRTPDGQGIYIGKSMTLAGYGLNGAKAELHEGKNVQYYLSVGDGISFNINDLIIDGENIGYGRLIMLGWGNSVGTTLTLNRSEIRNYVGHALIDSEHSNDKIIINNSLIHDYKGSYVSWSSAIMGFSYVEANNSKFYNCDGSYTWPNRGGAIRIMGGQTGVFTDCEFTNNSQHLGGAIYNKGTLTLNNCIFKNNHAAAHYTDYVKDYFGYDMADYQDNGGAIYNAGTAVINGGSITDNDARNNGGGVYNRDGSSKMTLNGVTIYNNVAGASGDDIFNREGGTITFEAVGDGWKLDSHPCDDKIDAWYDDSEDTRWNAHDISSVHVQKVQPGTYTGDALALKAAHDTGAYKVFYRLQNPDGTYGDEIEFMPTTLSPLSDSEVLINHQALDAELAKKRYRFAYQNPAVLRVTRSYGDSAEDAYQNPAVLRVTRRYRDSAEDAYVYTVVLTYDLVKDPEPVDPEPVEPKPAEPSDQTPTRKGDAAPTEQAALRTHKPAPRHMASSLPQTGDTSSSALSLALGAFGAGLAMLGTKLRRKEADR